MTEVLALREKLQCKSFEWYMKEIGPGVSTVRLNILPFMLNNCILYNFIPDCLRTFLANLI